MIDCCHYSLMLVAFLNFVTLYLLHSPALRAPQYMQFKAMSTRGLSSTCKWRFGSLKMDIF